MLLRQLIDYDSHTYTYLLADEGSKQACLIDPVLEQTDAYLRLLSDLDLALVCAIDTHVHADHISGLGRLRELTACATLVGSQGDIACASEGLEQGKTIAIGALQLNVMYTPGHTADSYCLYLKHLEEHYLFTGDTLLIRGCGRTDFQNGNAAELYDSLQQILRDFPDATQVLPAHDYKGWTQSTIGEERRANPRLQLPTQQEFVRYMESLDLPDPKMMDVAVPANQACGKLLFGH